MLIKMIDTALVITDESDEDEDCRRDGEDSNIANKQGEDADGI